MWLSNWWLKDFFPFLSSQPVKSYFDEDLQSVIKACPDRLTIPALTFVVAQD